MAILKKKKLDILFKISTNSLYILQAVYPQKHNTHTTWKNTEVDTHHNMFK